jgi:hypothetical protein
MLLSSPSLGRSQVLFRLSFARTVFTYIHGLTSIIVLVLLHSFVDGSARWLQSGVMADYQALAWQERFLHSASFYGFKMCDYVCAPL